VAGVGLGFFERRSPTSRSQLRWPSSDRFLPGCQPAWGCARELAIRRRSLCPGVRSSLCGRAATPCTVSPDATRRSLRIVHIRRRALRPFVVPACAETPAHAPWPFGPVCERAASSLDPL